MRLSIVFFVLSSLCFSHFAFAGDSEAGIMASNGCVNCHGAEGRGNKVGNIPPLAGRPKEFLAMAMEGYRKGTLHGTVMNRVMKDFDEQKIQFLAEYFSSIE